MGLGDLWLEPGSRWVVRVVAAPEEKRTWAARVPRADGRAGWTGLPTAEEVTMRVKYMLMGVKDWGVGRPQLHVPHPPPPDPARLLALTFLTLLLSAPQCLPFSPLWTSGTPGLQPLLPPELSQPPGPQLPSPHPGPSCQWRGPRWPALLSSPPPHSLWHPGPGPDPCGLIAQHSCPPPASLPRGRGSLGIQLSFRGQAG